MNNIKVCILDYGSGNIKSVYNLLKFINIDVKISNEPKDIQNASHLILPGVGAFGAAMEKINENLPLKIITSEVVSHKKPFLGICVGMQVLASIGHEFGTFSGLNWIPGEVTKLESENLPLPHVGWNNILVKKPSPLTDHFDENADFYFVHSFIFKAKNSGYILATTQYGEEFCSIINKDNIFGVQFHPEKSQKTGQILLKNFLSI